jgi:formylglycine-generating enzyme required for sulfatase activity
MTIFKPLSKNATRTNCLMSFLLISWLLTACATSAPQTAMPDVAGLSTAAVATVYANLTLSPVSTPSPISTPTPSPTPLTSAITDKFGVPMALVPAGPFLMGRGENNDSPIYLEVSIGDYYIDKYEVTNASYKACVEAGVCEPPYHEGSYTHASYYLNPDFANYPVLSRPRPP